MYTYFVCMFTYIHTYFLLEHPSIPHHTPHPIRSSQSTELPVLIQQFPTSSFFYIWQRYICQCYCLNLAYPLLPLLCPQVLSVDLPLYSYPANISSVQFARFHIYALIYHICFSFSDLHHSVVRFIHIFANNSI